MGMQLVHLDPKSVADAVDAAISDALGGPFINDVATNVPDSAETIDTSGVVTPANAAYTQADQTALADVVIALGANLVAVQNTLNGVIDALVAAGIMAS